MDLGLFPKKKRKRKLTSADKKRIAAKQGYKCKKCRVGFGVVYHIDHIKPHSEGGSDRESNLQALCPNCHAEKTEHDRHKKRQQKIRQKERAEKSDHILGMGYIPKAKPLDLGFGSPPKRKRKGKGSWGDFSI